MQFRKEAWYYYCNIDSEKPCGDEPINKYDYVCVYVFHTRDILSSPACDVHVPTKNNSRKSDN